ncbi:hypothetical protein, partial [Yersinia pestis]|uniref:hypothetical protein n=1 Tax=Yersinia pestis TaxID=632 RepID=UPI001D0FAAB9
NKSKGVFITDPKLKALLNPQPSWGFSGHKKNPRICAGLLILMAESVLISVHQHTAQERCVK